MPNAITMRAGIADSRPLAALQIPNPKPKTAIADRAPLQDHRTSAAHLLGESAVPGRGRSAVLERGHASGEGFVGGGEIDHIVGARIGEERFEASDVQLVGDARSGQTAQPRVFVFASLLDAQHAAHGEVHDLGRDHVLGAGTTAAASSGGSASGTSYWATTIPVATRRLRVNADTAAQLPTESPRAPTAATIGVMSATGFGVRARGWVTAPGSRPMATVTPSPAGRAARLDAECRDTAVGGRAFQLALVLRAGRPGVAPRGSVELRAQCGVEHDFGAEAVDGLRAIEGSRSQ